MNYGIGEMLGEVGGLFKALDLAFTIFIGCFTQAALYGYLVAGLYKDDPDEKEKITKLLSLN